MRKPKVALAQYITKEIEQTEDGLKLKSQLKADMLMEARKEDCLKYFGTDDKEQVEKKLNERTDTSYLQLCLLLLANHKPELNLKEGQVLEINKVENKYEAWLKDGLKTSPVGGGDSYWEAVDCAQYLVNLLNKEEL